MVSQSAAFREEDALILVSELVTNALRASWSLEGHPPIVLRLLANDQQLLIEAWDQCLQVTDLRPLPPSECDHGRGLAVVAALSNRWGVGRMGSDYKVVWCELLVKRR